MGISKNFIVENIQFIKKVSEYAGPYALYFRALVPLRIQLSESGLMLNCIFYTNVNNLNTHLSGNSYNNTIMKKSRKTDDGIR